MCKGYRRQSMVIELAKRDTPTIFAVYEYRDNVPDLVGIVKVFPDGAECWSVTRRGDTELWRGDLRWDDPSYGTMAGWFGLDLRECRIRQV